MAKIDLDDGKQIQFDSVSGDLITTGENTPQEDPQNSLAFDVAVKRTILILVIGAIILGIGGELLKPLLR